MRKKQKKVIVKILKTISCIVFIVLIGVLISGYSNHIGLFDTFEVKIKGNQFVTDAQIQKRLQPFISETYFSIKLDEIQNEISLLDFIECVQVSRILPNTVMVQIIERKPILLITLENENFLMDEKGLLLSAQREAICRRMWMSASASTPSFTPIGKSAGGSPSRFIATRKRAERYSSSCHRSNRTSGPIRHCSTVGSVRGTAVGQRFSLCQNRLTG